MESQIETKSERKSGGKALKKTEKDLVFLECMAII
jgi:hypothetical protein